MQQKVAAEFPPPPPPPLPPAEPEDLAGEAEEFFGELEELEKRPEALAEFTEDELVDFWGLAFGLVADWRGDFWELSDRSARRLGRWTKKVIDRRGGKLPPWLQKYFPELVLGVVLVIEVRQRWVEEKRRREAAPPATT